MNKRIFEGIVTSAELCDPLIDVHIQCLDSEDAIVEEISSDKQGAWCLKNAPVDGKVVFSLEGFVQKVIPTDRLPKVVRLLEDRLIGYQTRLWFLPGETVDVFVNSPEAYTASLFRHGFVKTKAIDIGYFGPQIQEVPNTYFVDAGLKWKTCFTYTIPDKAEPGLYSLFLETKDREHFAIPMVVSTPPSQYGQKSKLLVLASTNTWQAYNFWGGRSRYRNNEDQVTPEFYEKPIKKNKILRKIKALKAKLINRDAKPVNCLWETGEWELRPLSIQRPFTNCELSHVTPLQPFTNHLADGEWRVLAWLAREKIAFDIISGYELHCNPKLLRKYDAIILSTHSEYWSETMYQGLKEAHLNNNLWICNLSGNSIFRQVEFQSDGSMRCVSAYFNRSCEDETQILGVRYNAADYGTCAPYKILKREHWAFTNTPLNDQTDIFGALSLNQNTNPITRRYDPGRPGVQNAISGCGASGWETDKLIPSAPDDITVIAKGLNPGGGADMVIREPFQTRGGLFSVSSIMFGGALLIDEVSATIVKNVLSRALSGSVQEDNESVSN